MGTVQALPETILEHPVPGLGGAVIFLVPPFNEGMAPGHSVSRVRVFPAKISDDRFQSPEINKQSERYERVCGYNAPHPGPCWAGFTVYQSWWGAQTEQCVKPRLRGQAVKYLWIFHSIKRLYTESSG